MNRRTWGFVLLIFGLLALGAILVVAAAEKDKKVTKAYVGIVPGELTSDLAQEYGVKGGAGGGVLVEDVSSGSPAEKAGLRENDIITTLNGKQVTGPEEFRSQIGKMKPGDEVELAYLRGGAEHTAKVKLAEREEMSGVFPRTFTRTYKFDGPPWEWESSKSGEKMAYAGLITEDLSEGLAKYFKVEKGALISEVMKDSPADKAGLKAGDVITKIGDKKVDDEGDVRRAIHERKPGDQVDFIVIRDGQEQTVKVTLGDQTSHEDTGDLMNWERDSLGCLTLVPDQKMMDELKEELNNLKLDMHGLGDSIRFKLQDLKIPPVHIDVRELQTDPIRLHNLIHMHRTSAYA